MLELDEVPPVAQLRPLAKKWYTREQEDIRFPSVRQQMLLFRECVHLSMGYNLFLEMATASAGREGIAARHSHVTQAQQHIWELLGE